MKLLSATCVALLLLAGCSRRVDDPATTSASTSGPSMVASGPRIVCTTPAATFILVQIGAEKTVVGVSGYEGADLLPERLRGTPTVANYEKVNYEALLQVKPTAMVLQIASERMDERLKQEAAKHNIQLVNIHLDNLAELWKTAEQLGEVSGHAAEAKAKITQAKAGLADLARRIATGVKTKPRVLYVVGSTDMMVAGAGTFIDETIAAAGGINAAADVNGLWPTINAEVAAKLKPDVVILSLPGQPEQQPNDPRVLPWLRYPIPAAKTQRVFVVTDPNAQLATLDIAGTVESLAHLLHPDLDEAAEAGLPAGTSTRPGP